MVVKILFGIVVASLVVWVFTGIVTSKKYAEFEAYRFSGSSRGGPDPATDSFINLLAANNIAYVIGVSGLALMGGSLMVKAHRRLG